MFFNLKALNAAFENRVRFTLGIFFNTFTTIPRLALPSGYVKLKAFVWKLEEYTNRSC